MVLDLRAFDFNIHNETVPIEGRFLREVPLLPLESLRPSVRAPLIEPCQCLITSVQIVMVDLPATAKFLTAEEKNYVMWTKSTSV